MSVQFKDYYELLGVSRSATDKEIKSAYRKLARQYHPDHDPSAADKFKEINEAYEVLGDADKRKRYDSLGQHWRHGSSFNPNAGGDYGGQYQDLGDLFSSFGFGGAGHSGQASGFSDFFDMLFGGRMGHQSGFGSASQHAYGNADQYSQFYDTNREPANHQLDLNVEQSLMLSIEEVISGASKEVRINHSGKSIVVNIPKGVKPNSKIRVAGEGKRTTAGRKGDVFLIVQYQKHPLYDVDGQNLIYEVGIPVYDLVLGTEINIPTPQGSVVLTIRPGTQPGKLYRLKERGLPSKDGKTIGDLLVRPKALIPENPSEEEQALYQSLKKLTFKSSGK